MGILRPTKIKGEVHTVLINGKPDEGITTEKVGSAAISYAGIEGDWHSGVTRDSCVRVRR